MPTPPKPASIIKMEGKSHRTKAEIRQREAGEKALLTGEKLKESKEVKENKVAHAAFLRLKKLYETIGKNDGLYENIINRYCILLAECKDFEEKRELFCSQLKELQDNKLVLLASEEMTNHQYYSLEIKMQNSILGLDKQVQAKRKMLLDIEKESIMTIASALRTVPKKKEEKKSELWEALNG